MIRAMQKYFSGIQPVFIDGFLYAMIAVFAAMVASFNSEEAYKYIAPVLLYWLKQTSTWGLALVTAIKMFRSTTYSEHQVKKADDLREIEKDERNKNK